MKNVLKLLFLLLFGLLSAVPQSHAETKRILAVGNSFSYDAILQELLPVVRSGGDDILVGFPYKGGTTLRLHWQYITENEKIYNYYTIKDGKTSSTGAASRCFDKDIIASEPWDVVVIQTDHNYSGDYSQYFPYLDNLIAYLREHLINKDVEFFLYMTWAYQDGSSKMLELVNQGLYQDQTDQYAKITDCVPRAAMQSGIGVENIIPAGTAVQNGRTSYIGDAYNRDGYHLDLIHGRYTASLTWYAKIFGKSPFDVSYRPDGMSQFCADMCKTAVAKALETPMSVTSLQEDFGVNPDAVFSVLDRPVFINFGLDAGSADSTGNVWNSITSQVSGAALRQVFNSKGYGTDICVTVEERFDGIASDGMLYEGSDFVMPDKAARSSFYGSGRSAVMISGLYPGQAYDMKVYASSAQGDKSAFRFIGSNSGEASLETAGNSDKTVCVAGIVADEGGRIRMEAMSGNGGVYHLNALAIIPHLSVPGKKVVYINFTEPDAIQESGWNNVIACQSGFEMPVLKYADGSPSGISLKIAGSFAGTTSEGAAETQTLLNMPASVSETGFWVNGVEKDGILAECGEVVFHGLDSDAACDIHFFGSLTNAAEVYEAEYSTFGRTDNFIALNCNNNTSLTATLSGVYAAADGSLRITVTPGATSADRYKVGYINAMAIMVPAMIDIEPFEPVAKDPWDGKSVVQPRVDAFGNYLIYCGAELAWIAERVNKGTPVDGVKLASDIDLGGQPWTPIGYGSWFNGNFDGQGYHIRNMYINKSDLTGNTHFCALIGGTNNINSSIRNLYLSGRIEVPTNMVAKAIVGSLIGKANNIGSISNCHSDVRFIVYGTPGYVGGLTGFMKSAEVKNSSYSGIITVNGTVTNGLGGLTGCTNSSVAGVEAVFNGCSFSGNIDYKGSKAPKYVGGINGYSNITAGSETITNNYISGTISAGGSNKGVIVGLRKTPGFFCDNNYYLDDFGYNDAGGEKATAAEFHSGKVAYLLNGDHSEMLFGQNLDRSESMPEVYTGGNHVYKVTFSVAGKPYDTVYSNAALRLPPAPEVAGKDFYGWEDADGKLYTAASVISSDLDLSARFSSAIGSLSESAQTSIEIIGNVMVVKSQGAPSTLVIYSVDGRVVMQVQVSRSDTEIPMPALPTGLYIASCAGISCKFSR